MWELPARFSKKDKPRQSRIRKAKEGSKVVSVKRCTSSIADGGKNGKAKEFQCVQGLGDHTGSLGPHEIFTSLLGQSSSLGLLVVHALCVVGVLVIILNNASRDLTRSILLARSLGEG